MRPLRNTRKLGALALVAAGTLGAAAGCVVLNPDHCAYSGAACEDGLVCSKCAIDNNGCVPAVAVSDDQCFYVEGSSTQGPVDTTQGPTPTTEDLPTSTGTETSLEPTSTTVDPTLPMTSSETTETTSGPGCDPAVVVENPACGGQEPYCLDGVCVGCGSLPSCVAVEPTKPACEPDSGRCVGCLQSGDCLDPKLPVCDNDVGTCVKCSEHEQCPETACNLETGECFPPENVVYVNNTNDPGEIECDDASGGATPEAPLCRLQIALAKVQEGKPTTIKVAPGSGQSDPSEMMPGDRTVAIVPDGKVPSLNVGGDFPALTLNPGNLVFMYRVGIYNNTPINDPAISCTGARLWLDRQKIYNTQAALVANDCQVHVRRSVITGHVKGALALTGNAPGAAMLWTENSYITANDGKTFGAVNLVGGASANLLYTTIAANNGPVAVIDCIDWTGELALINSALADAGALFGPSCTPDLDGTYTSAPDDPNPYSAFGGNVDGVYSAKEGGPLKGLATWIPGYPKVDYNGDPRPALPDDKDYAGADVP